MAAFSSLALGLGAATSIAGTVIGASAQSKMSEQQRAASERAENARQQQMALDADRRRRQAFREALLARSTALTVGTAQNASQGSGVAGGMAQTTASGLQNQQTIGSAEFIGSQIFDANRDYAAATARGQSRMAWAGALSSFGNMMMSNAGTINRLGTYYTHRNSVPRYG